MIQIDMSELIYDFSFGFQWNGKEVDMIDNEFVHVYFNHMYRQNSSFAQRIVEEIGLVECGDKSYLLKYQSKANIVDFYGTMYYTPPLEKHHYL